MSDAGTIVAALDPARVTGVCWGRGGGNAPPQATTWIMPQADNGDRGAMFDNFTQRLAHFLAKEQVGVLLTEKPMPLGGKKKETLNPDGSVKHSGVNAASFEVALGLMAITEAAAYRHKIPLYAVAQSEWRKHFIGKGNLKRDEAKAEAMRRCKLLGWKVENDNEGDACGIWDYGVMRLRLRAVVPGLPLFIR